MQIEDVVDVARDLLFVGLAMQHRHLAPVDRSSDLLEFAGDERKQVGRDQVRALEADDSAETAR